VVNTLEKIGNLSYYERFNIVFIPMQLHTIYL